MKLSDFTPDFDKDGKKIYVIVGEFESSDDKTIFRIQVLMSSSFIGENDFILDGGDSSSEFEKGIDFGNANLVDQISKVFDIYSNNEFLEQLEFDEYWSKEVELDSDVKNNIELEEVIGYIYPIMQELKVKNKNYIFIEY